MTNILELVRVDRDVSFGTNEDWIDAVQLPDRLGNPVDLTGITFTMQVRHQAGDATVFINGSTNDGRLVVATAAPTTLAFAIPLSTMTNIPTGQHVYDVVASADGFARIAIKGAAEIFQGVTR